MFGLKLQVEPSYAAGAIVGGVVALWVGLGVFVQALIVLQFADVVTGLIAAAVHGEVSSSVSRRGLAKKATAGIIVMVVAWLSANLGDELGTAFPGGQAVAASFCLTELISLLENARRIGLDLGPLDRVLAAAHGAKPPHPEPPRV